MFVNKKVSPLKTSLEIHTFLWGVNSLESDEEPLGLPAAVCRNQVLSSAIVRIQELQDFQLCLWAM